MTEVSQGQYCLTCDLHVSSQIFAHQAKIRILFLQQHEDLSLSVFSVGWQQACLAFSLVSSFFTLITTSKTLLLL